jgi:protein-S-isoprenylcysteine O-methyltransferase Ste14
MTKRGFLEKHHIVRNAIREDLLYFALPALLVFIAGLVVSALDGWEGTLAAIWSLIRQPQSLSALSAQNIIGLILWLGGFSIAFVALFTLRWSYSSTLVIRENHQLITHGIYRFTRHPIYLGVILVCLGIPLSASSWFGLATMSVLIPIFLNRIRIEEKMLNEEFGEAYQRYKEATSKLIPFIY